MTQPGDNHILRLLALLVLLLASVAGGMLYSQATSQAQKNNAQLQTSIDDLDLYGASH